MLQFQANGVSVKRVPVPNGDSMFCLFSSNGRIASGISHGSQDWGNDAEDAPQKLWYLTGRNHQKKWYSGGNITTKEIEAPLDLRSIGTPWHQLGPIWAVDSMNLETQMETRTHLKPAKFTRQGFFQNRCAGKKSRNLGNLPPFFRPCNQNTSGLGPAHIPH